MNINYNDLILQETATNTQSTENQNKKYLCQWQIFQSQNQNISITTPKNDSDDQLEAKMIGSAQAFHNISRDYFKHTCIFSFKIEDSDFSTQNISCLLDLAQKEFFYQFNTDRIVIMVEQENTNLAAILESCGFSKAPEEQAKKATVTLKNAGWHTDAQKKMPFIYEKHAAKTSFIVQPIKDNILHITDGTGVFMTLIKGTQKALLVDTGWGVSDIATLVKKLVRTPFIVVNTHGHPDHCFGNCFFDQVLTPEKDEDVYKEIDDYEAKRQVRFTSQQMRTICKDLKRPPFKAYKAGDIFDLGGITVQAVPLYGHTKGALGLLVREERILLSGDSLGNYVWLFMKESLSLNETKKICQDLLDLPFDQILGSHTRVLWNKSCIKTMIRNIDFVQSPDFRPKDELSQQLLGYHTNLSMIDDADGTSGIVILDSRFYKHDQSQKPGD